MLSLTDPDPDARIAAASRPRRAGRLHGAAAVSTARKVAGAVAHEGLETLAHPAHVADLAGTATRDAATLAKLLASRADIQTVLREPLRGTRRVAWSTAFPLDRIRSAGHRAGGTINDVLIAAVTGAVRTELGRHADVPDDVHIMVPFNLRPLDEALPRDLGNDFALILLSLPVGIEKRGERLREVKMRMDAIKNSHEGPISYGILSAIGNAPPAVEDRLIGFFSQKASAVVTNVPGPREQVYFAGVPVEGVLVWAPCSGSIGMTVSIFSYMGEVTVGFMTDTGVVPDPQPLVSAFDAELRALCSGSLA
jgi:WS/DGAT/MGAT family acyltransferase